MIDKIKNKKNNFKEFTESLLIKSNWAATTQKSVDEVAQLFRGAVRLGKVKDIVDKIERESIFIPEIDEAIIKNGLMALGYEFVKTTVNNDVEPSLAGGVQTYDEYEGYIRGDTDIAVRRSTMSIKGTDVKGFELGIYTAVEISSP